MKADLDVIIVHYHAAAQLRDAVSALRSDAQSTGLALRIIVADNGSTSDERELLQSLAVRTFDTGRNAGYAGGINAAIPETSADCVVVMNEDVLVLPGCLGTLRAALLGGAAVAGPRFYWDRERIFMLPCTEVRERRSEVRRVRAGASLTKLQRARHEWRGHARRHWRATTPLPSSSLSGALLAFRRDSWSIVGPFDENFKMYYEEDDWLRRVASAGLTSLYVPQAMAIHLHNPTFAQSPVRQAWEAESFLRFGKRHYGEAFMRRLSLLAGGQDVQASWQTLVPSDDFFDKYEGSISQSEMWLELSPSPLGFPAAASRRVDNLKAWSASSLRGLDLMEGPLYLQLVDDDGKELGGCVFDRRNEADRS